MRRWRVAAVAAGVLGCVVAGAAAQARRPSLAEPDRYGRYRARLVLAGITPAAEAAALPGDVIPSGPGRNNISINYRNTSTKAWTSFLGKIYTTRFDPATKHYSGLEDLEIFLFSAKRKDPKRKVIRLGKGITFAEPLAVRISAQTSMGNYFWTEFQAPVERQADGTFVIPGTHYLDHYSAEPFRATPARSPATSPPAKPAPATPVAARPPPVARPAPVPAPVGTTPLPPGRHGQRQISPGVYEALPHQRAAPRVTGSRAQVHLAGFTPGLLERMKKDPVAERRGNVRLFVKNEGERIWGLIKKTTWRGPIADFEMRVPTKETGRISYDRPILLRVDVRTQAGEFYWTEVVRSRDDLEAPLVLDRYTGN